MIPLSIKETHVLVAVEDVNFVKGLVNKFKHSPDQEERCIGMIAESIIDRLGIGEKPRELELPRPHKKKITSLL